MKFKSIILFFLFISCTQNISSISQKKQFNSKGFALIYSDTFFNEKLIRKKLDTTKFEIAHNKLKPGSLIKIINVKTNDSIILKNKKRIDYPDFYKIIITEPVSRKLKINKDLPLVEIIELKKNKSFVAKKTKIYKEEKMIPNNAPVETVKIDNISKNKKSKNQKNLKKFYIIIAEFYSKKSALSLKKRIMDELSGFESKKLYIKSKKVNKISLISGPYNSINSIKNDYIQLKNFGFEELDITINE